MKYWLMLGSSMMFSCLNFSKEEPEEDDRNDSSESKEGDQQGDCFDGIDNDDDGYIDCEDQDCDGKPACEDDTDTIDTGDIDNGDTGDTDTDDGIETVSISAIQQGNVPEGVIRLEDVIVTTGLTSDGDSFFIQDEGGGEWSGIYVYNNTSYSPVVGDKITITASYSEFYDDSQLMLNPQDELAVTGAGQPVVTTITSPSGNWEPYEGCLVKFNDQGVTSEVNSYGEAELAMGIPMDDLFFDFDADYGGHYDSITGVISYSFEQFKINPRTEADLVGYTYESTPITILDVQSGNYESQTVTLDAVVVTAVDGQYGNFWVQDYGGGEWSGLYVYTSNILPNVNVGDVVTLTGTISEYYDLTEITIASSADIVHATTTSNPIATAISSSPSDWESLESVLISLQNVQIGPSGSYGQFELANYSDIKLDDELYSYTVMEGNTISSLTGIVNYSYGEFTIYPRYAADLVGIQ